MGVILDLRLIDHERIVVQGCEIVNRAIRAADPEILRAYLAMLPVAVDAKNVDLRRMRVEKLRELKAPEVIIQNEERMLEDATGDAYRPERFKQASLDELRQLLGTWNWRNQAFSLDKAWDELQWFLEPLAGPDGRPLQPNRPNLGAPDQTICGAAFRGIVEYRRDELGDPIVRTCGSPEADCCGYNPPEACREIYAWLETVRPADWNQHVDLRSGLYRRGWANFTDDDIRQRVASELKSARQAFSMLRDAYAKAAKQGFGVSCEYSL